MTELEIKTTNDILQIEDYNSDLEEKWVSAESLKERSKLLVDKFNEFIKKWCGSYYPHLIDTDENDGERFREMLKELGE